MIESAAFSTPGVLRSRRCCSEGLSFPLLFPLLSCPFLSCRGSLGAAAQLGPRRCWGWAPSLLCAGFLLREPAAALWGTRGGIHCPGQLKKIRKLLEKKKNIHLVKARCVFHVGNGGRQLQPCLNTHWGSATSGASGAFLTVVNFICLKRAVFHT